MKKEDAISKREAVEEAKAIFDGVWNSLLEDYGVEELNFPERIFWLNGAPGSGKGTNTAFIMERVGIRTQPVVISDLLEGEEVRKIMDAGLLVGDREVIGLLLRKLLEPQYLKGVIVDGFPRTLVQVECLKLLYQKIKELKKSPSGPKFHVVILYVNEEESVKRQLYRGKIALKNNETVRKTDLSEEGARKRYKTFADLTLEPLKLLDGFFHSHMIDASGSIEEVQQKIMKELNYQES